MSLNKKVLAAAIVGALMVGGTAVAAPLTVTKQFYANEIVFPTTGLVPSAAPAVTWNSGYNYSPGEQKYVRVEMTGATFETGMPAPTVTNGVVGAVNGMGTNVLTFSVTANGAPGGPIVSANPFSLALSAAGTGYIKIPAKGNVSIKVSLYDQASQAQAGGTTGLLAIGSYDDTPFLSFTDSYRFESTAHTLTADVASATPAVLYGHFLNNDPVTVPATSTVAGTLNNDLSIKLVDPDGTAGAQTATFKADGTAIALADLFGTASKVEVEGDFSAAAATGVTLGAAPSTPAPGATGYAATVTKLAWSGVPTGGTAALVYNVPGSKAIVAGDYKATFTPVAASATYDVTPRTVAVAGSIRRNGLELQAPLAQIPGGWISRLVLTNTGSTAPKYTISVLGETGNNITTANTSGTIAPGTTVIDMDTVMTGFSDPTKPRGTVVVSVEAKDADRAGTVQGLYQIVNPASGSISNHVMVRPGTN